MVDTRSTRFNAIAFYLPQFHQIPENDQWWGSGFTEWTNVRKAIPLFPGHAQPHIPTDLGYYDLTDAKARQEQSDLALAAGIEAFCYWHYWFGNGRRILEEPFQRVLEAGAPELPFCLCWANQSWTGVWHGAPNRLLIEQTYPGEEDYEAHFRVVLEAFRDPRYLRVDGKPVFVVYEPEELPDSTAFVALWRRLAIEAGLPGLHLIGMGNDPVSSALVPFDAALMNAPGDFLRRRELNGLQRVARRVAASKAGRIFPNALRAKMGAPRIFQYDEVVEDAFSDLPEGPRYYPCIIPGWDNTPRSGRRGLVIRGASAALFRAYLERAVERVSKNPPGRRLVFIKAWNEWAEGNYLEPDTFQGDTNLREVKRLLGA